MLNPTLFVPPLAQSEGFSVLPRFNSSTVEVMFYILCGVAALLLLYVGWRLGKWAGAAGSRKLMGEKEKELFTAQRGFKQVYETEMADLKTENADMKEKLSLLGDRLEEYRKKAAGYGGLFNGGGKRADAMYALLLENESLEEALHRQNEKLKSERDDTVKESMRSAGYRRVLMSQLMNDERIKEYVAEVLADDKRLPPAKGGSGGAVEPGRRALPSAVEEGETVDAESH